jgi:triphosphoribosyl-dephospho-CoA synthase
LELAILLEASANKPGNVNRTNGFEQTRYEHFLASAVAMSSSFELAAGRGMAVLQRRLGVSDVRVGRIISDSVVSASSWQRGGNTLLGATILLSPIAVAAGMILDQEGTFEIPKLRESLRLVVESTTPEDAVDVYEAIRTAGPGGLGEASDLDINDPNVLDKIRKEKIPLFQIFKIASSYDLICSEWVNNYPITFDLAYPSLIDGLEKNKDLGNTIVYAFLTVLAEHPDTLIARKTSSEIAGKISSTAQEILKLGFETSRGKNRVNELDRELRKSGNFLNPGTTADIIAAALSLCVLGGYRP